MSASSLNSALVAAEDILLTGSGTNRSLKITPNSDKFGQATIEIALSDSSLTVTNSFDLTVINVNDAPIISNISDQTIAEDTAISAINFTVNDLDDNPDALQLSAQSSDILIVPTENISINGTGINRTISITPAANQFGMATITVTVTDNEYQVNNMFLLTIKPVIDGAPIIVNKKVSLNTQIIISQNSLDSTEVGYFKITGITNGNLFYHNGITPIYNEMFINRNEAESGLMWIHDENLANDGSFIVQASLGNKDSDLGGEPAIATIKPSRFKISGHVLYYNTNIPVRDVQMAIQGYKSYTTLTDYDGSYTLNEIIRGYNKLIAQKHDNTKGLRALDVSRISQHVAGMYPFNTYQKIAADVTGNGSVSSTDASRVARYILSLRSSLNSENKSWIFINEDIKADHLLPLNENAFYKEYSSLLLDHLDEKFIGIKLGDVDYSWSNSNNKKRKSYKSNNKISKTVVKDSVISFVIIIDNETRIEGIDGKIYYNNEMLKFNEISLESGILKETDYKVMKNSNEPGLLNFIIYARSNTVVGKGKVAIVNFNIIGYDQGMAIYPETEIKCNDNYTSNALYFNQEPINSIYLTIQPVKIVLYDFDQNGIINVNDAVLLINKLSKCKNSLNDSRDLKDIIQILNIIVNMDFYKLP